MSQNYHILSKIKIFCLLAVDFNPLSESASNFFSSNLSPAVASPKCVRASLLEDWLLVLVEEVPWVEHVEKVELCVHWNGSLHPGLVGGRALLHRQLLQ